MSFFPFPSLIFIYQETGHGFIIKGLDTPLQITLWYVLDEKTLELAPWHPSHVWFSI
jgi:hypothetical protein